MNITEFQRITADPGSRRAHYTAMVPAFYDLVTSPYRANWSESFHLPPFAPGETLAQAVRRQEHELARTAGFGPGMRILDVGCGIGGPALSIARATGAHVTGVNIVAMHIGVATAKAAEQGLEKLTRFTVADMVDLPFPDACFDGAFSFDAICHSPDKPATYAGVHRVLKPGAVFTGCDWLCADGLPPGEYARWIEPICAYAALPSVLSLGQLADHLVEAGFHLVFCVDLSERGDMEPNWRRFEDAAAAVPPPRDPDHELLWRHATSTARGGRSGTFKIGYWQARKP
ncbi:SAM-dependent methyltransferase [Actinomadura rubrisoli]|uniref:Class I SAM-dependent methyltransferase n=1 Tax=Actinomadura rubrisoli TaxID=2530368 RepID=A0A4R5CDK7_9ACTN|nr:methyltransferase domain-containing protein [Actinomadura rubrisoli]TDD98128.1 class I SAM-dependent methyltransferase [Actinomadura rubrisoli]